MSNEVQRIEWNPLSKFFDLLFRGDGSKAVAEFEQGEWTPTVSAATSNPSVTYTQQVGQWWAMGPLVFASFIIRWSAASGGSGAARIGGLPFTTANLAYTPTHPIGFWRNLTFINANATLLSLDIVSNNTEMQIIESGNGIAPGDDVVSLWTTGSFEKIVTANFWYQRKYPA